MRGEGGRVSDKRPPAAEVVSTTFMLLIALMYAAAMVSFAIDGKWAWSVVSLCWGLGNALLAFISK